MFRLGDTVVFDSSSFNPDYWNNLSEKTRIKYYGCFGYGRDRPHFLTFLTEHHPQTDHCILISMETQEIHTMCHTDNFRSATEEEC